MASLPVRAYTDRFSYERGGRLSLHVDAVGPIDVRLIRMRSSSATDTTLDDDVAWEAAGSYQVAPQATCVGSFLHGLPGIDAPSATTSLSFGAFVWSGDMAASPVQTLVSAGGLALQLHDGRPVLESGETLVTGQRLVGHEWHLVVAQIDRTEASVTAVPLSELRGIHTHSRKAVSEREIDLTGPVTVGARGVTRVETDGGCARGTAEQHFTGKIERPFVLASALDDRQVQAIARGTLDLADLPLVAGWDLAFRHGGDPTAAIPLAPGQPVGRLVNGPSRGVTGRLFTGRVLEFNAAPDEYAAAHFHSTDLVDAGWQQTVQATLPDDLESGVYGIVVESGSGSDTVPITVVPRVGDERHKVAVVLPTFTYLAYANEALFSGLDASAMTDQDVSISAEDLAHVGDTSFGLSMYDHHTDGSGVMLSAGRRHIVNMRRGYRMWLLNAGRAFSADMYLIEWCARRGIDVDVITDQELHARGAAYIADYSAVISGSHPEYTSEEMLDALTEYRDNGGGLMYLGGNGWYWVTGVLSDDPLVVEIRRGMAGVRCWESYPGEVSLMSTGLPGGLWRHRGRAPQALAGVGFAAQGWGRSEPYDRLEVASAPEHAWIFDKVDEDPIGAYGAVMGGAAGDEVDRVDRALGTPHHAAVLATSSGRHSNFYQRVVEEIAMNLPDHGGGQQDPEVRADIVYFTTPGGGEVFSTGSIAWSGSLLHDDTRNGVSQMTENVVRAFVARRDS
ncbi:N,N-dimethylformamidase beta subunit family domain-containing protein [Aeromicrobium sp. UC242_57]|uniref:N,N-dimethylformamidase beta subunit family domain-containing protein n=1 Tax=Aeromicrobium sp. UC242_57 TaxID=3374624 RepID=UPI00378BD06E